MNRPLLAAMPLCTGLDLVVELLLMLFALITLLSRTGSLRGVIIAAGDPPSRARLSCSSCASSGDAPKDRPLPELSELVRANELARRWV